MARAEPGWSQEATWSPSTWGITSVSHGECLQSPLGTAKPACRSEPCLETLHSQASADPSLGPRPAGLLLKDHTGAHNPRLRAWVGPISPRASHFVSVPALVLHAGWPSARLCCLSICFLLGLPGGRRQAAGTGLWPCPPSGQLGPSQADPPSSSPSQGFLGAQAPNQFPTHKPGGGAVTGQTETRHPGWPSGQWTWLGTECSQT